MTEIRGTKGESSYGRGKRAPSIRELAPPFRDRVVLSVMLLLSMPDGQAAEVIHSPYHLQVSEKPLHADWYAYS